MTAAEKQVHDEPETFTVVPQGPFALLHQNTHFHGWPTSRDGSELIMAFPVEGWEGSAAVTLRQAVSGVVEGRVFGAEAVRKQARRQAIAALSLDEDGSGWEDAGRRDPFVGSLQKAYHSMRPTLFHSPYEGAAGFIVGHRISIAQARRIRQAMAEAMGTPFEIDGTRYFAFPSPEMLLGMRSFPGVSAVKIERLHHVAEAALDGWLTRDALRSLPEADALEKLRSLPGVGPFFAQGILYRAAGIRDALTTDDMTFEAISRAYGMPEAAGTAELLDIANRWRPYRMWAVVLLHVWLREQGPLPPRTFVNR